MEAPMQYNTLSGNEANILGSLGTLGMSIVATEVLENTAGRMLGMEWSMIPGSARMKRSSSKFVRFMGKIGSFGPIPDAMPLNSINAASRITSFASGGGPIFNTNSWLSKTTVGTWMNPTARKVNEAFIGTDLIDIMGDAGASMGGYGTEGMKGFNLGAEQAIEIYQGLDGKRASTRKGRSLKGRKEHWKSISGRAKVGELANTTGRRLTSGMSESAFNKAAKAVADLELRGLHLATLGRVVAWGGATAGALAFLDAVGGIIKFGHDKGMQALVTKKEAQGAIRTGMGETLRMQALQMSAMSFGAMRSAIGSEAMGHHRYA
jgi:hypothetical protein